MPRLAFINKLDREGSDPDNVIQALRQKLFLNATALQLPMGLSKEHEGVVDLVMQQAYFFEGHNGARAQLLHTAPFLSLVSPTLHTLHTRHTLHTLHPTRTLPFLLTPPEVRRALQRRGRS